MNERIPSLSALRRHFFNTLLKTFIIFLFISGYDLLADEVQLHFWQFSLDEELSQPIIQEFERAHPHIKIHMQQLSWDFGHDKIVTSLIADNAPDVFELGSTWVPHFSQSGVLKDITTEITPFKHQYMMWEPVTFEGKIYGMPWLVGTRFLFYNKDLFVKAGLNPQKPPRTWEALKNSAQKIRQLSNDTYGYAIAVAEDYAPWHTFIPYLWNKGGDVLSGEMKKSIFYSPATLQAFQFYKELTGVSLLNRQEQIDQLFSDNKIGMILSGAWNFKAIERTNSKLNYGVSLVPTPELHQKPYSFGGGEMLVMLHKTKIPKEAFQFMQYLISKKVELMISKKQRNVLPSFTEALQDSFFQENPNMKGFADQMLLTRPAPPYPEWLGIEKIMSSSIDKIILQNQPIPEVVQKASDEIDRVLKQTKAVGTISDKKLTSWISILMILLLGVIWIVRGRSQVSGEISTWIFLSPWLVLFLVFGLYPLLYSMVIGFADYNILTSRFSMTGLENYLKTLKDPEFVRALLHTLFFAIGTIPFTVIFSLLLAVLIHEGVPWKSVFQAGFFLPVVTSIVVIATLFTYFYAENGFLNMVLDWIGIPRPKPAWLINQRWALIGIMAMAVWSSVGYYLILFLAGLQSIPVSLYEASRIDGATTLQQFFKITLPQLKPIILFVVVINTINSFQVFPEIFTMTKGGPSRSTTTVVYYLYEKGFSEFRMGTASAVSYMLAIIIGLFAYFQLKLLREKQ